jgi:hypothetical protein
MWVLLVAMAAVLVVFAAVTAAKGALSPKPEPVRCDGHDCRSCCHNCRREDA